MVVSSVPDEVVNAKTSVEQPGELSAEVATKSGGLSDSAKQNNGGVTADEVCFQHGFMRVRAELLVSTNHNALHKARLCINSP